MGAELIGAPKPLFITLMNQTVVNGNTSCLQRAPRKIRLRALEDLGPALRPRHLSVGKHRVLLGMPASNCTAERSFSVLRKVKSYHLSTMSQTRLNSLALLSKESSLMKDINYSDIIHSFASQ